MARNRENISEQLAGENEELVKDETGNQRFDDKELKERSVFKYISPMYYMERSMVRKWQKETKVKREDLLARVQEHGAEIQAEANNYVVARQEYDGLQGKLQTETGAEAPTATMDDFIESMDSLRRMKRDVPEGADADTVDQLREAAAKEKGQVLAAMDFFTPKIQKATDESFPYRENYTAFGRIPRMDIGGSLTEALEAARANGGKLLRMSVDIKPRHSNKSTQQDKYIPLTAETADLLSEKATAALRGATGLYSKRHSISFRTPPEAVVDYQAEILSLEEAEKQKQPINVVLKFKVNDGSRINSQETPLSDGDFERLKQKVMGRIVGEEWVGGSGMNTVSDAVVVMGGKEIPFQEFMGMESMPQ